jgi:hypothetical protein
VHVECLMCYACGSVDIQFLHVLSVIDLMDSFDTFFARPSGSMVPVLGNTQIC